MRIGRLAGALIAGLGLAALGMAACSSFVAGTEPPHDSGADVDAGTSTPEDGGMPTDGSQPDGSVLDPTCGVITPGAGDGTVPTADTLCGDATVQLTTNAQHCGACFHSCGAVNCQGGSCNTGAFVTGGAAVATFLGRAGEYLYWSTAADAGASHILRAGLAGTAPEDFFLTDAGEVTIAGLTPTRLYLPQPGGRMILLPTESGGTAAPVGDPGARVDAITTAGEAAFYIDVQKQRVLRVDPGAVQTLANDEGDLTAIAADSEAVYWLKGASDGGGLFTRYESDGGRLVRASTIGRPVAVTVDDLHAYVFDATTRQLRRLDKRAPEAPGVLLSTWTGPENVVSGFVADDLNVYMLLSSSSGTGRTVVVRVSKCGGVPLQIVALTTAGTLAVHKEWLYMPNNGAGIRRGPK